MSHYTEPNDRLSEADARRDTRANSGDWPTPDRPLWIHRTNRRRRATTCAWFHEGLRLSLVVWLSQYMRRCGQWTAVNIDPPKRSAA